MHSYFVFFIILNSCSQDFELEAILAPYQPVKMKAMHFPIDPRLSFTEANQMLAELQPGKLVASPLYTDPSTRSSDGEYGGQTADGIPTRETAVVFDPARTIPAKLGQISIGAGEY